MSEVPLKEALVGLARLFREEEALHEEHHEQVEIHLIQPGCFSQPRRRGGPICTEAGLS